MEFQRLLLLSTQPETLMQTVQPGDNGYPAYEDHHSDRQVLPKHEAIAVAELAKVPASARSGIRQNSFFFAQRNSPEFPAPSASQFAGTR